MCAWNIIEVHAISATIQIVAVYHQPRPDTETLANYFLQLTNEAQL